MGERVETVGGWGGGSGHGYLSLLYDPRPSRAVDLDLILSCSLPGVKPGPQVQRKLPPEVAIFTQWAPPPPQLPPYQGH